MKTLLFVYASQSGHTRALVDAAAAAAGGEENVAVRVLLAQQAGLDDLLACQALVLATPENFGYMAGALKDFLDRTFYPAQGRVEGLPFAVIISAGNDGQGALAAIRRIACGYPLREALPPLLVKGEVTPQALEEATEMGATLAAALSIGML